MKNEKLKNALAFFHASGTFSDYLIGNEYDREDSSRLDVNNKEEYAKLLVTHSALLFALFKEDIVSKDVDKELFLNIYEDAFDKIMSYLCDKDNNHYILGDMSFDNKKDAFDLIRNKLLHGDYIVDLDNSKIILNDKGITGSIDILNLVQACKALSVSSMYNLTTTNQTPLTSCFSNVLSDGPVIYNLSQLKKFMKEVYVIKFIDKPMAGYERDQQYLQVLMSFHNFIKYNHKDSKKKNQKQLIAAKLDYFSPYLKAAHIDINYEIIRATQLPEYEKIQSYYLANREYLNKLDSFNQRVLMLEVINNMVYSNINDNGILASGLLNNIEMLLAYINGISFSDIDYIIHTSITYLDDMSIAAVCSQFYAYYHYELDELYSKGGSTSLKDIAAGTYFNFSELQIDELYDPNMTIDNVFNDFDNQLEHLKNALDKAKILYDKANDTYEQYKTKAKSHKEEVEYRLSNVIYETYHRYQELSYIYQEAKSFMEKDYDKYVKNYNIIAHIRNAFAHGNVKIKHHFEGDTLNDREIIINDIYEGKSTFYLCIKYKDFIKLFDEHNAMMIYNFIRFKNQAGKRLKKLEVRLKKED